MKTRPKNELDVDSIGEQKPITQAELKALSDYFNGRKKTADKPGVPRRVSNTKTAIQPT
jgi:hypothetical protein